ncbi:MAG: hypothetical protein WCP35_06385 [Verrucomicrobiota bacterium]
MYRNENTLVLYVPYHTELDPKLYDRDGTPVYRGAFAGAQLNTQGLPVKLGDGKKFASAFLLSEKHE